MANFYDKNQNTSLRPDTPVRYLSGVGAKRAGQLAGMGIETVRDLLYHFPRAYQHRGDVHTLAEGKLGEVGAFILTVSAAPVSARLKGRLTLTKMSAFDETGKCDITFFNQAYLRDVFPVGSTFRFWGKLERRKGRFQLTSPDYEPYYDGLSLPEFKPVYPLTEGITQKYISKIISAALEQITGIEQMDILPDKVRVKYALPELRRALGDIHNPEDYSSMEKARRRFVFEELYIFALGIMLTKKQIQAGKAPVFANTDTREFEKALPFPLTRAQKRVISEIAADVGNKDAVPMSRLVSGDVGSGKTVCAAAAAYMALKSGYQAAIMAPTEILAHQHYEDLKPLFEKFGFGCELLTGSTPAAKKREIRAALAAGRLPLVIGTHALLTSGVEFACAGLFVTDEQHRFGVMQRAALAEKGVDAHVLVMTATPIPRTLALILYGDLSLSQVDEMPPGRQKVLTFLVDESYRERMTGFIEKQALEGRQVYIVCPSIEGDSENEEGTVGIEYDGHSGQTSVPVLKNAVDYEKTLKAALSPKIKTALMHGRLPAVEKERIMESFAKGEIQVLVSTTVIEVGVNVPNATLMIVENAERFGMSQLHQLRGRVGRGKYKSWCILVSDTQNEVALERLNAMTETSDGYLIAQKDLALRGPGDFFPSHSGKARQHGAAGTFLSAKCADMNDLRSAFDAAAQTVEKDPLLEKAENRPAHSALEELFEIRTATLN